MDVRTLRALEWDRVLALLSVCASTEEGKERAGALQPCTDIPSVRERHARVGECLAGERLCGRLSLEGYGRTATTIPRGMAFPLETFRQLRDDLRVWRRVREWVADPAHPKPVLSASFPPSDTLRSLAEAMERLLDDRGEVADGASDRLRGIRRERERARGQVLLRMETMAEKLGTSVLREVSFTIRNGRFVLPVQSSYKSTVKGILHDTSSTGATAFIEPLEVVELNNRLTNLDAEEREEIQRILIAASARVTEASGELDSAMDGVEALDLDLACGRLGRSCGGILPQLDEEGRLVLRGARHPLLDASLAGLRQRAWGEDPPGGAVPLDVALSLDDIRTLVISGPNAGGKSVAIKTVGVLCAMHQAGIPIPAQEGTRLPVFPFIHATVGDSQSILDSLSTFSARMVALREALRDLKEPFLVVLDELGSGTDPSEGAALGEAILLHFHALRGFTICSTHYESVKARALITEGMGNAGMEFEEEDLRPTYRLKMGQVGASRALEIAERSGLPGPLLEMARSLLPEGEKHLKEILSALEEEIAAHEREEEALKARGRDVEAARRALERAQASLEQEKSQFLSSLPDKLRAAEERFLEALKPEINRQSIKKVARRTVPEVVETQRQELGVTAKSSPAPPLPSPGDRVRVVAYGVAGTVVEMDPGSGKLVLDCDGKTLTVGVGDVEVLDVQSVLTPSRTRGVTVDASDARWEINLIGQTVAEAEAALDPFVDRAAMAGLGQVRIIHGIGTGRLRAAVRAWARQSPLVEGWEEAPPSGGGAGVTLLNLKV